MTHPSKRASSPLTFDDLAADLVWPKLFRAAALATRPARLGLALVWIIGVLLILGAAQWILGPERMRSLGEITQVASINYTSFLAAASQLKAPIAARELRELFVAAPALLIRQQPLAALIIFPLLLVWTALLGGAIARSCATEFSAGVTTSWPQALAFALSRWKSLVFALLLPLLIIWAIALGLAGAGWLLFSFAGVNVLGGLLYFVFLLAGLVGSIVAIALAIGHAMLIPSVACEGTDAIDAVQHAYSFVFARPLRLVIYLWLILTQMFLAAFVVALVLSLATHFAHQSAAAWSGDRGSRVLMAVPDLAGEHNADANRSALTGTNLWSARLATFWAVIPVGLLFAYVVSFYWCSSTILYLAMRRVVDGQDVSEVWMPTMIDGTQAPRIAPATQAVSDTGPADET